MKFTLKVIPDVIKGRIFLTWQCLAITLCDLETLPHIALQLPNIYHTPNSPLKISIWS